MKWTMKDGKRIPLWLMTDSHIQNTINLLSIIKEDYIDMVDYLYSLSYSGDYEHTSIEQEIRSCVDMVGWVDRWIKRFINEQERRKSCGSNRKNNEAV